MSDRTIGGVLVVLSALFFQRTFTFKAPPFEVFQGMGAAFFPRGILIALGILGLVLVVRGEGSLLPNWELGSMRAALPRYRDVIISLAMFPIYVLGISYVGFLWATAVYLVVMQLALHPRMGLGLVYVVLGSFAFTWAIAEVFQRFLSVVLPSGSLF